MKSKLIIITACVAIPFIILPIFLLRSNSTSTNEKIILGPKPEPKSAINNVELQQMNDKLDHLFYFVQISDLHISKFRNHDRITDFRKFVDETLDVIKPPVVVASGDLTDGRGLDAYISQQNEDEWKIYNEILRKANVAKRTKWLDLRGNHDTFNVANNTYFKRYSMQGPKHNRSYMELIKDRSGDLYAFIAVDACLQPGPKRPYNFVGLLKQSDTDHLQHLVDEAKSAGVKYAIWFGHYPTTCIVTRNKENRSLKRLIGDYDASLAYLSGHLHTVANLIPHMYALQEDKFFELEVGDWKECRRYRVAAIDHGLLSFVDVDFGAWPIVLITNPKNAMFQIPNRNEAKVQLESTHIRILAFSPAGIGSCNVKIDKDLNENCQQVNENLFVVPWKPERYRDGLHSITVTVVDKNSSKNEVTQSFRLDEKQTVYFDTLAQFVLHTHALTLFSSMFLAAILLCIVPLIFYRIWHELIRFGVLRRMRADGCASNTIIQHYWILASVNRIFWPVILYCIYLVFGPWNFSELSDGHYGFVFAYVIYVDGVFLPGSLTFFYGCVELLLSQLPLIWVYARCLAKRYSEETGTAMGSYRGCIHKFSQILFYVIITIQIAISIFNGLIYGASAFFLGVFGLGLWSLVFNITLFYLARNVPEHALRSAMYVWSGTMKEINTGDEIHAN